MSNDQLSFISLTDPMVHNMENMTSARFSLLHIDEAMNDIISFIILNNYIIIIIYYLTSKFSIIFVVSKLKYLDMYLSRQHNIISMHRRTKYVCTAGGA